MAFKDIFVKSSGDNKETPKTEPIKEKAKTQFPTNESTPTESVFSAFGFGKTQQITPSFNKGDVSPEHLSKAVERYKNGFDSLNQPGYDFYEYYQAVTSIGADNPQGYPMAFTMAKTMDKTITKEGLLSQSEFYQGEINKSYQDTIAKGNAKKDDLVKQKEAENKGLVDELHYMQQQLETMKAQILDRENKLKSIGSKYEPQISEIDSKLAANDIAKNQIMQSIEQVKTGIINNLK